MTNNVVNIFDGHTREAFIEGPHGGFQHVWWPEHLTKQGEPSGNRKADGWLHSGHGAASSYYFAWALFEPARETKANLVRKDIETLSLQLQEAHARLFALYGDVQQEATP